jgi:peptidoglycan hydrolase CwlO-like protein
MAANGDSDILTPEEQNRFIAQVQLLEEKVEEHEETIQKYQVKVEEQEKTILQLRGQLAEERQAFADKEKVFLIW